MYKNVLPWALPLPLNYSIFIDTFKKTYDCETRIYYYVYKFVMSCQYLIQKKMDFGKVLTQYLTSFHLELSAVFTMLTVDWNFPRPQNNSPSRQTSVGNPCMKKDGKGSTLTRIEGYSVIHWKIHGDFYIICDEKNV